MKSEINELKKKYRQFDWDTLTRFNEGYSIDEKYLLQNYKGDKFILRLSDIDNYPKKKLEEKIIKKCKTENENDFSDFSYIGTIKNYKKMYTILRWIEGIPLLNLLGELEESKKYYLGIEIGKKLRNIHNINVDYKDINLKIKEKILAVIQRYKECDCEIKEEDIIINYILKNIDNIDYYSKISYLHGDFHIFNFLYTKENRTSVIDFERCHVGYYCEDFYATEFYDRNYSTSFSVGKIDGYFNSDVPEQFWNDFSFFCAIGALDAIVWANNIGVKEVEEHKNSIEVMLYDFDSFKETKPKWYNDYKRI